jgi:hypothetical protein
MNIAYSGVPFGWDYTTYDQASGLYVAAKIYDITSGTAFYVTTLAMSNVYAGSYSAIYTGSAGKVYQIISNVYTDSGFTTLDTGRAPGCEVVQCVQPAATAAIGLATQMSLASAQTEMILQSKQFTMTIQPEEVIP